VTVLEDRLERSGLRFPIRQHRATRGDTYCEERSLMSQGRKRPARRRLARIAVPVAATLALAGGLVACGDDDDDSVVDDATEAVTPEDEGTGTGGDGARTIELAALNGSGVSGTATLSQTGDQLMVVIEAAGLEADQPHAQHIHQPEDGSPATCPGPDADGDGDGVVSLEEGLPSYGPVALALEPFPSADADGVVSFDETLTVGQDLGLENDAIVLHGLTVDGEYVATLPVACGTVGG
jgi:hypothetical protein